MKQITTKEIDAERISPTVDYSAAIHDIYSKEPESILIISSSNSDDNVCPFGGDIENDCADCIDSGEYHFENGECVERTA